MSKTFYVVNPHSANGNTGKKWPLIWKRISQEQPDAAYSLTKGNIHATYLAGKAIYDGYDVIVAVGGDGTLNEVLNGFFDSDKMINPEAVLGFLANGTGQDFARSAGFTGEPLLIDIGIAQFAKPDGTKTVRRFINEASVGFGANVAEKVNKSAKLIGGKTSFYIGLLKCLAFLKNSRINVSIDGKEFFSDSSFVVTVSNGKYFGGGMMISPRSKIDDGRLEIVCIKEMGRIEILGNIPGLNNGKHIYNPKVKISSGCEVVVTSKDILPIEMDGEVVGVSDMKISVVKGIVRFRQILL